MKIKITMHEVTMKLSEVIARLEVEQIVLAQSDAWDEYELIAAILDDLRQVTEL